MAAITLVRVLPLPLRGVSNFTALRDFLESCGASR